MFLGPGHQCTVLPRQPDRLRAPACCTACVCVLAPTTNSYRLHIWRHCHLYLLNVSRLRNIISCRCGHIYHLTLSFTLWICLHVLRCRQALSCMSPATPVLHVQGGSSAWTPSGTFSRASWKPLPDDLGADESKLAWRRSWPIPSGLIIDDPLLLGARAALCEIQVLLNAVGDVANHLDDLHGFPRLLPLRPSLALACLSLPPSDMFFPTSCPKCYSCCTTNEQAECKRMMK